MSAGRALAAAALWLLGTALIALALGVYWVAGSGESTDETARLGIAAVPVLVSWAPLAAAIAVARRDWRGAGAPLRASALLALAVAGLALARMLATGHDPVIFGDRGWVLFWLGAGAVWICASALAARGAG